jgi:hypothetical protein
MALDWNKIGPDTPVSQLSVGELLDLIGWALTHYKAGEQGDVAGFSWSGAKPNLPNLGPNWKVYTPQYWNRASGGQPRGTLPGLRR